MESSGGLAGQANADGSELDVPEPDELDSEDLTLGERQEQLDEVETDEVGLGEMDSDVRQKEEPCVVELGDVVGHDGIHVLDGLEIHYGCDGKSADESLCDLRRGFCGYFLFEVLP